MWYTAESMYQPELIDAVSSKKYAYLRRNVHEENRVDEAGDTYTVYVYQECKLPKEVLALFTETQNANVRLDDLEDAFADILGGAIG